MLGTNCPSRFYLSGAANRAIGVHSKGAKSNIRAFHDAMLTRLVPLPVVTAQIDRLIAEDGKGSTQTWSEQPLILNSHVTALPFRAALLPHNRPRECL